MQSMIIGSALWGLIATIAMTAIMQASQGLGLSRLSLPLMIGTILTARRDRAAVFGFGLYMIGGWLFAVLYYAFFTSIGIYAWWLGAVAGFLHGLFLLIAMPLLPYVHPRMASEYHGVTRQRQLEPPGFMGINYGYQTPVTTLLAQTVYGATLGAGVQIQHAMSA